MKRVSVLALQAARIENIYLTNVFRLLMNDKGLYLYFICVVRQIFQQG